MLDNAADRKPGLIIATTAQTRILMKDRMTTTNRRRSPDGGG